MELLTAPARQYPFVISATTRPNARTPPNICIVRKAVHTQIDESRNREGKQDARTRRHDAGKHGATSQPLSLCGSSSIPDRNTRGTETVRATNTVTPMPLILFTTTTIGTTISAGTDR